MAHANPQPEIIIEKDDIKIAEDKRPTIVSRFARLLLLLLQSGGVFFVGRAQVIVPAADGLCSALILSLRLVLAIGRSITTMNATVFSSPDKIYGDSYLYGAMLQQR